METYAYVTGNATDQGRERDENQDYFGAYEHTVYGDLWIVCDGMGGAQGGRTASILAVEAVRETMSHPGAEDEVQALFAGVAAANQRIFERSQATPELKGMGTTLVALLIHEGRAYVTHVGDSRAYLLRDGTLRQFTKDHTLVQEMLDDGALTPEQARHHPDGNIITRSVGIGPQVAVDIDTAALDVQVGDRWVLCTDGLTGQVSDELIQSMTGELSPARACRALVTLANEAGGPDNITIQVVEVRERPAGVVERLSAALMGLRPRWTRRAMAVGTMMLACLLAVATWLFLTLTGESAPMDDTIRSEDSTHVQEVSDE